MRTVPNMFVASLAVSDFSTGIFFKHFIVLFGNSFKMAFWRCNVPISRLFIINFGINLGSHKGIDGGEQIFSNRQTRKVPTTFYQDEDQDNDCCPWIYSAFPSLSFMLRGGKKVVYHPFKNFCHVHQFGGSSAFSAIRLVLYLALPSCVILFSYFRIFQKVRNHNQNFHFPNGTMSAVNVEEIKITIRCSWSQLVFRYVGFLFLAIDIADTVHGRWIFPREVYVRTYVAYSLSATLNSALNPIILVLRNRKFRREYFKLLRCSYFLPKSVAEPMFIINDQTERTAVGPT